MNIETTIETFKKTDNQKNKAEAAPCSEPNNKKDCTSLYIGTFPWRKLR
jgi:hypothetical protein